MGTAGDGQQYQGERVEGSPQHDHSAETDDVDDLACHDRADQTADRARPEREADRAGRQAQRAVGEQDDDGLRGEHEEVHRGRAGQAGA